MRVAKLTKEAILPTVKHVGDAGMDFYAYREYRIGPHSFSIIATGITVEIPQGYVMLLKPKSKNNFLLGGGVVDSSYQGEILFKIFNNSERPLSIYAGDPVGQGIFVKNASPTVEETSVDVIHTTKTARGSTGGIVTQLGLFESMGDEVI